MPVKSDANRRWVEMEFEVPGTPEQVWQAVATGPGLAAWFTKAEIEEKVGGKLAFDMGCGGVSEGVVTEWEPPHRFCYEEHNWSGDAPPIETETVVTERPGGGCVVRLVHSLATSDTQWDVQMQSFEAGWPGFFEILRIYLGRFPGQPSAMVSVMTSQGQSQDEVWTKVTEALNLAGVKEGERRESPERAPRLVGVVEKVQEEGDVREVRLRLEEPYSGACMVGTCTYEQQVMAAVNLYLYGADAVKTADAVRGEWEAWFTGLFE
jgi:uncharacterized protein YndB with AHSA1/START domain